MNWRLQTSANDSMFGSLTVKRFLTGQVRAQITMFGEFWGKMEQVSGPGSHSFTTRVTKEAFFKQQC